ncbi:ATP-binding protein [Dethiobacter alkaliphilus]|uniref:histidine kinase n=1 Tax=Dethiobacter alkaliphilus AHT 1 TaxID=555088 RepID=C0GC08_DETAL|nr:ATP-binding protein [Dethiobacter alkaliphilus]EEG78743.1 PAS/PAC sensor signal transduction histidine kinase [Dethiobacter alkaliphilus AHT 1]
MRPIEGNIIDKLELGRKSEKLLEDLKNEQERERSIFAMIPIGIAVATDSSCQEIIHNPASAEIFRIPGWHSTSFANPKHPPVGAYQNNKLLVAEQMPLQRAAWKGENVDDMEFMIRWPDGVTKHIQASSRPLLNREGKIIGAICTTKDITPLENKNHELQEKNKNLEDIVRERTEALLEMQSQFARLSRLDLMGELAGSIGHEIRNPMTTVRGYLQLLLNNQTTTDTNAIFEIMIDELDRANDIITEFLSIAQTKTSELKDCNLNTIITSQFPLMEARCIMSDVTLKTELDLLPLLKLDAKLITQLLLNLVHNGLEAMDDGGVLTISTYTTGSEVILSVADQGKGIPPQNMEKISKPFFTTKESGTGLGLPVCQTIARKHDAVIDCQTSKNGTTFIVKFKI